MEEVTNTDWATYYDAVGRNPARDTLVTALDSWSGAPGFAIDLGCGSGRDTLEMLRRGWRVLAIDREPDALQRLKGFTPSNTRERLSTRVAPFEGLELQPADLVNASYCLPFCEPDALESLWSRITEALQSGGLFAGHFFGDHDDWAGTAGMNFHSRDRFDARFTGWNILQLDVKDEVGATAIGDDKHWHTFSVVARKPFD
jgi:SAM-dependent methyltransferase